MLKYWHCWFGQAKPSVSIRFTAPRRLFTSHQGRTGSDTVPPPNEGGESRRQAAQSSGVRSFGRWGCELCLAPPRGEKGRGLNKSRRQGSNREGRRRNASVST